MKWRFRIELAFEHPVTGLRDVCSVTMVDDSPVRAVERAKAALGDYSSLVELIERHPLPGGTS